jgi:glucoside 3-dehydrogenase (cytochrome c) hitch-hiker subunit
MGTLSRRDVLLSSAAVAVAMTVAPARIWAATRDAKATALRPLLDDLCDAVIPATNTAGARAAGVGAFVELAAAHGMNAASEALLSQFATALDGLAGGAYLQQSEERRRALLADIDARAFAKPDDHTMPEVLRQWPTLKGLILIGYYTSEIGASEELRYILVPGRFDPDVPLQPGDRAWSSDWTGVKFG